MQSEQSAGAETEELAVHPYHGAEDVPAGQTAAAAPPHAEEHAGETHVHLPPQSIWPVTVAFGVGVGGAGAVLGWQGADNLIVAIGVLIVAYGLTNWVQELRHERH